jgi:hypothetical protein
MKAFKKMTLLILVLGLIITACKKEKAEEVEKMIMTIVKNNGHVYEINKTTGTLTLLDSITIGGVALGKIRDIYYHTDGNIYGCMDDNGGGKVFKANADTKIASYIYQNTDNAHDGVAEILFANNKLYFSTYGNDIAPFTSDPFLFSLNLDGTNRTVYAFSNDDICCGMGMEFKDANNIYISSENNIYVSNLSGTLSDTLTINRVGFPANFEDEDDFGIPCIEKDETGKYFVTIYNYDGSPDELYFARMSVSGSAATLTYISTLSTSNNYRGLSLMPEKVFK